MSKPSVHLSFIDACKAIAAQLIVLHHLSAYGPLAEAAREVAPMLMTWLFEYGRIAVQVFLVVGGFLAARGLAPTGEPRFTNPLTVIWRRYLRLVLPFLAALALAMLAAAWVRPLLDDDFVPGAPGFVQWLSHALLLHGVLDQDALSAGVWYVAIDFQLFSLMALALWLGRLGGMPFLAPVAVLALAVASLFVFNRNPEWDNWGVYFFGSYGLGAAAWWASARGRMASWLGVIAAVAVAALVLDFRLRIAVALAVALALGFARRTGWLERWPRAEVFEFLGRISYSLFLVHFPVCLVANALIARLESITPLQALGGVLLTWGASVLLATVFFRYVESAAPGWKLVERLDALLRQTAHRIARSIPQALFGRSGS